MDFKWTGRRVVRCLGCAGFCLIVCVLAFWNRSLVVEPVSALLRGESGFAEMKSAVERNYLEDRFRGKDELITLNGGYAGMLGRTQYNGTIKTTNGMLTTNAAKMIDTTELAEALSRFHRAMAGQGIPFLFILTPDKHPTEENILPAGLMDFTNEIMDQLLAELNALDVPFLDLRQTMSTTAAQVKKYFYRTDHHWNTDGAFYAYQQVMEAIRANLPDTKTGYTDISLWEKHVLPDWWLGSHGRRVGVLFNGADDLDYYLPLFDTQMSRYSPGICAYKGNFRQVCIEESVLQHIDYMNMDGYNRYLGRGNPLACHRNVQAENQKKLLIIRDSFMVPVECFLSTEFTAIDVIDPRGYGVMYGMDYALLNRPDMAMVMISPSALSIGYFGYRSFGEKSRAEVVKEITCNEISVSSKQDQEGYAVFPAELDPGKDYVLTIGKIQTLEAEPDFVSVKLEGGDADVDQTVFDVAYGNQFEFRWAFRVPENSGQTENFKLCFYAGLSGDREEVELIYHNVQLQECVLTN